MRTFWGLAVAAGVTVNTNVVVAAGPLVGVADTATDAGRPTNTPADAVADSPSAVARTVIV
jgi:hypothetical protein